MAKRPVNLRIDSELWERVRLLAGELDTSATALVERGLREVVIRDAPLGEVVAAYGPDLGGVLTDEDLKHVDPRLAVEPVEVPTARQLQGRTGLPLAACERHLKLGTWRSLF